MAQAYNAALLGNITGYQSLLNQYAGFYNSQSITIGNFVDIYVSGQGFFTGLTNQLIFGTTPGTLTINATSQTGNNTLTIADTGVTSSRFILEDYESNTPGTIDPQVINSDLQLLGSAAYILNPQLNLSPNMVLFMGPSNTGVANKPIVTGTLLNDGNILIGATGSAPVPGTITGTTDQVIVTNAANTITLSLPQDIDPTSQVQFASVDITQNDGLRIGNTIFKSNSIFLIQLDFPPFDDTMVGRISTDTLENKSLETGSCIFIDSTDNTKELSLDLASCSTTTNTTLSFASTSNRTYNFQDPGTSSANIVLTELGQLINGTKSFSSGIEILATSNQILLGGGGGGFYSILTCPTPSANRTITLPDAGADSSIVLTEGNQIVNGTKSFSSGIEILATSNQILLGGGGGGFYSVITCPTPAANRTVTLPDVGADSSIVLTAGSQTITGGKTFSNIIIFENQVGMISTSNQLILGGSGGSRSITINGPTPAANRTYTIPDVGANSDFVMAVGSQNISGSKTFQATQTISSGGLILPSGGSTLSYFEESAVANLTFAFGGGNTQTCNFYFSRIGNTVNITWVDDFQATIGAAGLTDISSTTSISSQFRYNGTNFARGFAMVSDNTIIENGILTLNTSGVLTFNRGALAVWTNGTTAKIYAGYACFRRV